MSKFKKVLNKSFKLLPLQVKETLVREMIDLPIEDNMTPEIEKLVFKIAETSSEYEQAFHLLYESYLEQGFVQESPSRMHILPHHVLPTTTLLIAKYNEEVVGTLSIVKREILGLPAEKEFDIDWSMKDVSSTAEISALSVKKNFRRRSGGKVFFLLLKFMYEYCVHHFDVHNIIAVIHPKDLFFYKGLFLFKELDLPIVEYMGAPAQAIELNLRLAYNKLDDLYSRKSKEKNIFDFFVNYNCKLFQFKQRPKELKYDFGMSKETFEQVVLKKSDLFKKMTMIEFYKLKETLYYSDFSEVMQNMEKQMINDRNSIRHSVHLQGSITEKGKVHPYNIVIKDASTLGIKCFIPNANLDLDSDYKINLLSDNFKGILTVKSRWKNNFNQYGFEILDPPQAWIEFFSNLNTKAIQSWGSLDSDIMNSSKLKKI